MAKRAHIIVIGGGFTGAALALLIALFTGAAGLAMVRRDLAGRWLGWFGLVVAVIGLFGIGEIFLSIEEGLEFRGAHTRLSWRVVLDSGCPPCPCP